MVVKLVVQLKTSYPDKVCLEFTLEPHWCPLVCHLDLYQNQISDAKLVLTIFSPP